MVKIAMPPTDPRRHLLDLAAARGVSLSALSALIGRNPAYLQQFVKKGSPRRLAEDDRRKLARFFGVGESALGGGDTMATVGKISRPPRADWVDVPRLAAAAAAGPGRIAADDAAIGAFRFSTAWLRGQGLDPRHLSAIAVAGDSMAPLFADGDEVLVDRTPRPPRDGVHVVRVGEALLIKHVDFSRPGRIGLISANTIYRPLDLAREEVAIIGRVVWKSGRI